MPRPTLQIIADRAGVSKMTVSRALRNHPNCGKETIARVNAIAKELNYKKHPLVSALMTDLRYKKNYEFKPIVALLHLDQRKKQLHPNLKRMRSGAKESANQQGYDVVEFYLTDEGMTTNRMVQIFNARGIHGIIFVHSARPNIELEIDLSKFACVATKYCITKPALNRIETSQFQSVLLSIEKLKDYGYKSFGLVTLGDSESISQYRRTGATLHAQRSFPEEDRIPILNKEKLDGKTLTRWIDRNKPEVILSQNHDVYELLIDQGYKIPEDVAYIYLGLYEFDGCIAGINPNWNEMGRIAANQVIDQLNRNEVGVPEHPIVTPVQGDWVDGATLPNRVLEAVSNEA
ncbi:MAG: LacI family DNA-binding transcriptional regulator [Verrucomicrobia bacterium]|nr:LacI family DNA-binding transcriptional regulator [Verrucomicrobiota bacterium]